MHFAVMICCIMEISDSDPLLTALTQNSEMEFM